MKLFVFDFDHTIVKGHTHNAINRAIVESAIKQEQEYVNAQWGVVHYFPIIGSEGEWETIFKTLWEQGHCLSIASFNAYEPVISEFLRRIGLSEEFIQHIDIIAKFPKNPKKANKNSYIMKAIRNAEARYQEKVEEVILIDDSVRNIQAANQIEYTTIQADNNGSHLQQLFENYIAPTVNVVPPVNRHLKPKALEPTVLMTDQFTQAQAQAEGGWENPKNVGWFSMSSTDPLEKETVQVDQYGTYLQQCVNDYVPPVNRYLKPKELEATALVTDQFTQAQAEGGSESPENVGCYSTLTDSFYSEPVKENFFSNFSLNLDGSTAIIDGDQSSECFLLKKEKEKEKIKSHPLESKEPQKPNWFHNYFFPQPKDNAQATGESKENQSISPYLSTIKRGS